MLFNSFHYLIFFPLAVIIFYSTPLKYRWISLFFLSCYFYMALIPAYILVLFYLILIDYFAGRWIENAKGKTKKIFLIVSLIANLGTLVLFKYWTFLDANISQIFQLLNFSYAPHDLGIALPIGLSFHTFQSMSYVTEVYFGRVKAEKHLGIYAVYVLFFPQMVAGPIERPQNLLPQLHLNQFFSYDNATAGLRLIALGLFKKSVLADNFAPIIDQVYNRPQSFSGIDCLIATYLFAAQIYCDFSGYTDIARGSAKILGFDLMINFKNPYSAVSFRDFWNRWHISLTTWFRDYVYIPLGGNRVSSTRHYFNIMMVFALSGLWHGANWTFIIWGILHGIYLSLSLLLNAEDQPRRTIRKFMGWFVVFHCVCFAWIFFRADSVSTALLISQKILMLQQFQMTLFITNIQKIFLCAALIYLVVETLLKNYNFEQKFLKLPTITRWAFYYAFATVIIVLGNFDNRQFIYFQF